jgi:hypothetical protein
MFEIKSLKQSVPLSTLKFANYLVGQVEGLDPYPHSKRPEMKVGFGLNRSGPDPIHCIIGIIFEYFGNKFVPCAVGADLAILNLSGNFRPIVISSLLLMRLCFSGLLPAGGVGQPA